MIPGPKDQSLITKTSNPPIVTTASIKIEGLTHPTLYPS